MFRFVKYLPLCFLSMTVVMLFTACDKAYVDFGSGFVDKSATHLAYLDSSTVEISSISVDSFSTTNNGSLFCGYVNDPAFGKINATSFFSVSIPSSESIPTGAVYDSVELILPLNGNYYGDTTSFYNIEVHKLQQVVNFSSGQTAFYNTSQIPYYPDISGSKRITVQPHSSDSIAIKLSSSIGQDLFTKLNAHATEVSTVELFDEYFKGFAITGDVSGNLILGFTDSVKLRMYYTKPGVFTEKAWVDFDLYRNSKQFYQVKADRAGTALSGLTTASGAVSSNATNHLAFGQYLTGSMIKIRFPYLRNILQLSGYVKIMKAELVISPDNNNYSRIFALPQTASMAAISNNGLIGDYLTAYSSTTNSVDLQTGNLFVDQVYGKTTAYTFDVTTYLQNQIEISENNNNGLVLLPESGDDHFDRFVIGDRLNADHKTILKIYYAAYE